MSTKKFTHSSIFSFNLLKTQTVLLFFLLNLIGALAHSGEVFSVGQPAIKKIKTAPSEIQINKKKPKNEISKQEEALQRRKVFQSLEERRYGEAHFSGIVMSRRRVQEAGGVDNCFVSIRITQLEPTRHQPLVGLKRGDIVRNVLDTPLCDLRVGSRAKGLLIDNNFFVDGERSLMLETF
jgi:hypothetical protein